MLASILTNVGLAEMEIPLNSPARSTVDSIGTTAMRAETLVQEMLAYSGKGKFIIQPLDLSGLVKDMAQILRVSISKKATLSIDASEKLPAVEADAAQIQQVVMNLIINASEALGDAAGIIKVNTGTVDAYHAYLADAFLDEGLLEGRYVYLEVTDTGVGMDRAARNKIFDPFFTTKGAGRGLGLSAVLGIVRSHKGAIRVDSEPGRGTTFTVLLPSSEQSAVVPQNVRRMSWRGTGVILVVDDEQDLLSAVAKVLKLAGFTVITALNGRAGITIFRSQADHIDAVLLDLTLPDVSGEEVFREIRTIRPDVKVILTSAYNEQEIISPFQDKGLTSFIQKPYQVANLIDKVHNVLGGAEGWSLPKD
jgi:two-component system, cell cycle sensor histidine kinase and response regulator CckA